MDDALPIDRVWTREFRYDSAESRYMNRPLNPATFAPLTTQPTVWSDYDGDEIYGDFTVSGTTVTNTDAYESGLWRKVGTASDYLHSDMLGTLRTTSGTSGSGGASRVFTAFGERITSTTDRFGFVGAWGYQSTPIPESPTPDTAFPYLHVGARYYDPSSGRFLQRDPIGIGGGPNVFEYAWSRPTTGVDPDGLFLDIIWDIGNVIYDISQGNWGDAAFDAAAALVPFVPAGASKILRYSDDAAALIGLAKDAKRGSGVTEAEARIFREWGDELGVRTRGPEVHPDRPFSRDPHMHVGPVNHIPVKTEPKPGLTCAP